MEEAIIGGQWSPPTSLARHGLVEGKFPSSEGKFPSRRENGYPLWQGSKIDLENVVKVEKLDCPRIKLLMRISLKLGTKGTNLLVLSWRRQRQIEEGEGSLTLSSVCGSRHINTNSYVHNVIISNS